MKKSITNLRETKKSNNGITLVALVITIIVLLILVGITVASLMGENGLLTKADKATIESRKAEYEEELKIIANALKIDKEIEGWDKKTYADEFEKQIQNNEKFKDTPIIRKDDTTIEVITKEGDVFVIEGENIEYKGTQGENVPPDLQEGDIEFNATPSEWTNSSVKVKIATKVEGYILQYSLDGSIWQDYKEAGITVTDNTVIYARMINNIGETGGTATGNIENIDRLEPNTFTPTATSTTNSITLTGSTTDQTKTETNGSSGIAKYYFSKDNGATWEPKDGQTETSYTFNNLTQTKDYSLKMKAVDNAGNETITETVNKGTGTVEGLISSNVTFTNTPSGWTKGSVSVTINTTVTGYTLQYSTDNKNWNDYTGALTYTQNGAVYARLKDSTGQTGGTATGNVTNIDKLGPNTFTPTATSTTNSITLTGSTTDQAKTATNGSSGIAKYYFSKDNGTTWEPTNGQTGTSYTFSNVSGGTTYNLKMKAVDNVGNETMTNTVSKKAEGVWLPTGATVLENNINKGLVIKDSNNNEWVWIEVPKSIYTTAKSSTDYANIEKDMQNYAKDYRDSEFTDTFYSTAQHGFANATEYNNWKNSMLKSVYENEGFYIGRYEIGTDNTSVRNESSGISARPYIKQDMIPYNYITCLQAQTLAKQLATNGKTSSLMFGIQWDLVMKFIETKKGKTQEELKDDSGTWGNYVNATFSLTRGKYLSGDIWDTSGRTWNTATTYTKTKSSGVLLSTGATTRNSALNIYDLAGNLYELTLEKTQGTNYPCADRGGCYNNYGNRDSNLGGGSPASRRGCSSTSDGNFYDGARPALW